MTLDYQNTRFERSEATTWRLLESDTRVHASGVRGWTCSQCYVAE